MKQFNELCNKLISELKCTKKSAGVINQWEEYIDDNGYGVDDQGNRYYAGKSYGGKTYGLHGRKPYFKKVLPTPASTDIKNLEIPDCPKCGKKMKLRKGKYGQFFGCSDYPNCTGTAKIK